MIQLVRAVGRPFVRVWRRATGRPTPRLVDRRHPLREFVYLDDISVQSLRASQIGAIPSEVKEMRSAVLAADTGGSFGLSGTRAAAGVTASVQASRSSGTEVLRKSISQSDFKAFRDYELPRLLVRAPGTGIPRRFTRARAAVSNPWMIPTSQLTRGELIELAVTVRPAAIFQTSAIFTALLQLEATGALGETGQLHEQMEPVHAMIIELLSGLVPLECVAADYQIVTIDAESWLVHTDALPLLTGAEAATAAPVVVAAVTVLELYWKDLRRILFANLTFTVMARIASDGLVDRWSPLKLADVLRTMDPAAADLIDNVGEMSISAMRARQRQAAPTPATPADPTLAAVLQRYARASAEHVTLSLDDAQWAAVDALARQIAETTPASSTGRAAFTAFTAALETQFAIIVPPAERQALRLAAWDTPPVQPETPTPAPTLEPPEAPPTQHIIEAELIAIYW